MKERIEDGNATIGLGVVAQFEEVLAEHPTAAKAKRSGRSEETVPEEPGVGGTDSAGEPEEARGKKPAVPEGRVMKGLTVKELEMMPKLEQISRLEEIPVGGTTNIEAEVIGAITGVAAQAVEGVASLGATSLRRTLRERVGGAERRARGVAVEVGRREVILDISVRVIYGYSIPSTVIKIRQNVADRLLYLCGLLAKEINVKVVGIEFPARMPGRVQ